MTGVGSSINKSIVPYHTPCRGVRWLLNSATKLQVCNEHDETVSVCHSIVHNLRVHELPTERVPGHWFSECMMHVIEVRVEGDKVSRSLLLLDWMETEMGSAFSNLLVHL
jgi:aminoglycoside phosphotransferase